MIVCEGEASFQFKTTTKELHKQPRSSICWSFSGMTSDLGSKQRGRILQMVITPHLGCTGCTEINNDEDVLWLEDIWGDLLGHCPCVGE